jgi:hypothetical protein
MTVSLRELQEQFQDFVINKDPKILEAIDNEQANALERADIYRDGYALRLLEILEKSFPVLVKIVSYQIFETIARKYIDKFPSHDFNICNYNNNFPQFLLDEQHDSFWYEVADFELALAKALDTADAPQIDMTALGGLTAEDWPNLQFEIHPSVEFYQYHYNTPQIVLAHLLEEEIPEQVREEQGKNWIVWRLDLQSYYESLTPEQLWMMHNIKQGKTFEQLCEGLCQWISEEEVAQFAAGSLANWLQKKLFSAFSIATQD